MYDAKAEVEKLSVAHVSVEKKEATELPAAEEEEQDEDEATQEESAAFRYADGAAAMKARDYDAAIELFGQALKTL